LEQLPAGLVVIQVLRLLVAMSLSEDAVVLEVQGRENAPSTAGLVGVGCLQAIMALPEVRLCMLGPGVALEVAQLPFPL